MKTYRRTLIVASMNGSVNELQMAAKDPRLGNRKVLSHGAATTSFRYYGIEPDSIVERNSAQTVRQELGGRTSAILTGTQVQDKQNLWTIEQRFWRAVEGRIRTIAVLDAMDNLKERFAMMTARPDGKIIIARNFELILPTAIAVPSEEIKQRMVELGFPTDRLYAIGSPGAEYQIQRRDEFLACSAETRRKILAMPAYSSFFQDENAKLVVWLSDSMNVYPDIGFDEKSVMQEFLGVLDNVAKSTGLKINVIVRPHPFRKDDAQKAFDSCTSESGTVRAVLHNPISNSDDKKNFYTMEELFAALRTDDILAGTFNLPIEEASRSGWPMQKLSFVPEIAEKYKFQQELVDRGIVSRAINMDMLAQLLNSALTKGLEQQTDPRVEMHKGALDRLVELCYP
ncbi:MAG: hypothetical protein ABIJ10_02160 [Candidatus Micrarchaeota archaeon]